MRAPKFSSRTRPSLPDDTERHQQGEDKKMKCVYKYHHKSRVQVMFSRTRERRLDVSPTKKCTRINVIRTQSCKYQLDPSPTCHEVRNKTVLHRTIFSTHEFSYLCHGSYLSELIVLLLGFLLLESFQRLLRLIQLIPAPTGTHRPPHTQEREGARNKDGTIERRG